MGRPSPLCTKDEDEAMLESDPAGTGWGLMTWY